ncbi:hypothetical protein [Aurantiacibacter arachoides]|uniref:hypothetical protein n=1 Tax=Aurantiacibacter arachoides TaxID=1850444 RepID=UPI0035709BB3
MATSDCWSFAIAAHTEIGLAEDERMIEAVQALHTRDPRPTESLERSVKSDGPGVQVRRILGNGWSAKPADH